MAAVDRLARRYVAERRARLEFDDGTARKTRSILRQFVAITGCDTDSMRVTRRHVERFLEERDIAPATARNQLSALRVFCKWCVLNGHMRSDPTIGVRGPRQPQLLPRALRADLVRRLLADCPDARARLIVLLMVQEGLRCCEVSRLQLGDVDFGDRTMLVRGKRSKERFLPVSTETWEALEDYLRLFPAGAGPLIRSYQRPKQALSASYISKRVNIWMATAGIKGAPHDGISAHALRHTAATDMLLAGAHLRNVQSALGHASLATTQRYLPRLVGELREAMGGRNYLPDKAQAAGAKRS